MTNTRSSKTTDASSPSAHAQKSQQDMLASLDPFAAIDTGDQQVRAVVEKARRVAGKPIAVLLQGESGVGKEWLARAIHHVPHRDHAPFVAINCGAIAEHLIEAELFGYAPWADSLCRQITVIVG